MAGVETEASDDATIGVRDFSGLRLAELPRETSSQLRRIIAAHLEQPAPQSISAFESAL